MGAAPSIACSGCGSAYEGKALCASCGSAMVKICGECKAKSVIQKNFCDHCGSAITLEPVALGGHGGGMPLAGYSEQPHTPMPTKVPRPFHQPVPTSTTLFSGDLAYLVRSTLSLLFLLAIVIGIWLFWKMHKVANSPEVLLPRLARRYLTVLSRSDYATAYAMFSSSARAGLNLQELTLLHGLANWSWEDLRIAKLKPQVALLEYRRTEEGQSPQIHFLFFLREADQWAVAYNENFLIKAREAWQNNKPEIAYIMAQGAVRVNPYDPLAYAFLCQAVRELKIPGRSLAECVRALELAEAYPSVLPSQEVSRLREMIDYQQGN